MRAEADHAEERDGGEAEDRGCSHLQPPAVAARGEHEERHHEPRRQLHPDSARERQRGGARAGRRAGAEQQREAEREDQERVVVGAADGQHEQHRVQSQEHRCEAGGAAQALGRAGREPHRGEAREGRHGFERPQRAGEPQRSGRVAREREQRSIWRVLERPADEVEGGIARSFGREVRVGVEAVQRAHTGEGDVAEDVLGDQRWSEGEDHVGADHRRSQPPQGHGTGARQGEEVGAADDQNQRLELPAAEVRARPGEWAGQPPGPATDVRGHVSRRGLGGVESQHEQRGQQRQQGGPAEDAKQPVQPLRRGRPGCIPPPALRGDRGWPGRLHESILTAPGSAGVLAPM